MNPIELPTSRFSFDTLNELITTKTVEQTRKKVGRVTRGAAECVEVEDFTQAIEYAKKYFFRVKNTEGEVMVWECDDFVTLTERAFKCTYLNNLPGDVSCIMSDYETVYERVCESNKPRVYTSGGHRYINTSKHYLLSNPRPEPTPAGIAARDAFYRYVLTVLCSYNTDMLEYIKDWVANLLQGHKNASALILCGPEGLGKSTFAEFIVSHVLHPQLCLRGNDQLLTGPYTQPLEGVRLCVFEEMSYTPQQWMSISAKLKTWITEPTCLYRSMYRNPYNGKMEASYILNSNHASVVQNMGSGRRWCVLDASAEHVNDHAYFNALRDKCFTDECANAVWHDLYTRDVSKFNAQSIPETLNKRDLRERNITPVQRWVRDEFFIKRHAFDAQGLSALIQRDSECVYQACEKGMRGDGRREDFYIAYAMWCEKHSHKALQKTDFYMNVRAMNIREKRTSGAYIFDSSFEHLEKIMQQFKLVADESDDVRDVETPEAQLVRLQNELMKIQHQIAALTPAAPAAPAAQATPVAPAAPAAAPAAAPVRVRAGKKPKPTPKEPEQSAVFEDDVVDRLVF